ncbi:MAG TPA: hypothetical protein DIW17_09250 [Clostridiales bacterium]|nr:hypothetical protein [Clostridiales bacterium]
MDSNERLLKVLNGEPVDRVPISTYELCGYNSLSFENQEPSYKGLMDYIRKYTDCICMWNPASNDNAALSSYSIDVKQDRKMISGFTITNEVIYAPKGKLSRTIKVFDNVYTQWTTEHLCKDINDVDIYLSIPFEPLSYDYSDLERVKKEVGNHGILMSSLADPVCTAMELMEFGDATVWALTETDHFGKTIREIHNRTMVNLEQMLKGGVVELYRICGPEYLTPPYLPPSYFKQFVVPYVREMTEMIQSYDGKVRIHSHGRIGKVLDYIKDIGADAIDPCEGPPDGDIPLKEVKRLVGDQMCIFGNIQLKLLENGTTDQVRSYVKDCMEAAKEGGHYVIMPTAAPINVPLSPRTEDNYKAFISASLEYGSYS